MTAIFENAVTSIVLGIEDFETNRDDRMISAARNYYAGLLLLGKACLIQQVPDLDPMDVIGARFKPKPDGSGGVQYMVEGFSTIDLRQLRERFKDFGLRWPEGDTKRLQKLRNNIEHFHLDQPISELRDVIASSFPMVVDLFKLLKREPKDHLGEAWFIMLEEHAAYQRVKEDCMESFRGLPWPDLLKADELECSACGYQLVRQSNTENDVWGEMAGTCVRCGATMEFEMLIETVVAAHAVDPYSVMKYGEESPVRPCPECGLKTYLESSEVSHCLACETSVGSECLRCGKIITVDEYSWDSPEFCSYCAHMSAK